MDETIAALATTPGIGAIAIIRLSGEQAISIVNKFFIGKDLEKVASHTINYGFIKDKSETIDEVLVTIMRSPKTFTREDVVEINCHGGVVVTNRILELLFANGVRPAEPGEFTKRAFLNGRIDLVEAEAISDLINVKSEKARKIAINQLKGQTSKLVRDLRSEILDLLGKIEVNIDYPEYYDIEVMTIEKTKTVLSSIKSKLNHILTNSIDSKMITDGIKTAIIGRPNVGKSSILNRLLDEDKAIVTDIAGTTRDIVEGTININGIALNIIDTAGIHETSDIIEKIGVDKSINLINQADLIVVVLNNNEELTDEDKEILTLVKGKNAIVVLNKCDLPSKINKEILKDLNVVNANTIDDNGLDELKKTIHNKIISNQLEVDNYNSLSNLRQITLIKKALEYLNNALTALEDGMPLDMIELDIKSMWNTLGEITGDTYTEELLDHLFSQFCLGK